MTAQCEECLSILNEKGVSMENIRIGEDSVNQEYYDLKLDVCANREIIVGLPFDTEFSNYFMELVQKTKYEVDIDITPQLSRASEIRKEKGIYQK